MGAAFTRQTARTLVGWIMIIGHFLVIFLLVFQDSMSYEQKIKILLTLGPIATAYFVSVVKSFILNSEPVTNTTKVNMNYFSIAILLPTVFMVFIIYLVISYPSALIGNSDSLQQWIASIEIALGGTVGFLVDDLFPKGKEVK